MVVQLNDTLRIQQALRAAGLDRWTVAEPQEAPFLLTVDASSRPGRVWLRPHFTTFPVQLEIAAADAIEAIERWTRVRLNAHEAEGIHDVPRFACEDEALSCWDFLVDAAAQIPAEPRELVANRAWNMLAAQRWMREHARPGHTVRDLAMDAARAFNVDSMLAPLQPGDDWAFDVAAEVLAQLPPERAS